MLFHILLSIPAALALLLILVRLAGVQAIPLGTRKIRLHAEGAATGDTVTYKDILRIAGWAFFIRVFTYLLSIYIAPLYGINSLSDLFNRWANWDGGHYLNLAESGYSDFAEDGRHLFLVFFPLYPWLIRLLHLVIPSYLLCALMITNLSFIGGCCFLYALVAGETSKQTAFRTVLLLSLFPFSFFFGAVRTEGLFFLTSAASLYYIRRHRFFTASLLGALAALTRMHGLLLVLPAAAEIIITYHPFRLLKEKQFGAFWKDCCRKALCLPITAVGTLIYLLLNWHVDGNPFQFLIYQKEHWFQGSTYFTNTLHTIWEYSNGQDIESVRTLWLPQLVLFFFSLAVLLYGIRRVSVTYSVYFFVYLFMNYSITWPLSCGRYMTCALPMFIVLAKGSEKHPNLYRGLAVIFTALLAILLPMFITNKDLY